MALLLGFDGRCEVVTPADKEKGFSLAEMYVLIGCTMIEVVYLTNPPGRILIIDEEGKFRTDVDQRFNRQATDLLVAGDHIEGDWITGNALLVMDNGVEFK